MEAVKIVATELAVGLAGAQNLVGNDEDLVGDSHQRALGPPPRPELEELGREIAALRAHRAPRRFTEQALQPRPALEDSRPPFLPGTLEAAGRDPRRRPVGRWETHSCPAPA